MSSSAGFSQISHSSNLFEEGGPSVKPPERIGFGIKMIDRMMRRHVKGASAITYKPSGVEFEIAITA